MNMTRTTLLALIAGFTAMFFIFGLQDLLTLETLKAQQLAILDYRNQHLFSAILLYMLVYIAVTGLSLPGATILTLAGGAVFGLFWGTIIVSFASSIGATLAFLAARFLFRDMVKAHFGERLNTIDEGMAKEGAWYLFSLRLVPLFPFFVINLLMGLTPIKTTTYYWVSQLGMLAGTIVYVNAGTQLGQLTSLSGILSPSLLGSFALLGIFPLLAKYTINFIAANKIYQPWPKPKHFDNNVVVIGAGAGGLVSAYISATLKAKITLIEQGKMGGDCLNTGCVPSKALIRAAKQVAQIRTADDFGIKTTGIDVDFAKVMANVHAAIKTIEPHDSIERYTELGVDVIQGTANIISPWEIEVSTGDAKQTISTRAIIIATGAHPFIPAIPGLENIHYLTSDTIWNITELPKRLLVIGGGPIGCELAQCFARFGSEVTQVEMAERLLIREDAEISELISQHFQAQGITVLTGHTAKRFSTGNDGASLWVSNNGQEFAIGFDQVLIAIGRSASVTGYGLEQLGVSITAKQSIAVNAYQETNYPNIFACGDVAGPFQFTHVAAHQAWYATVNALFGGFKKFRTDYSAIPWATFTDPEIARVGLNEQEAQQQNLAYELSYYQLDGLDRAITDQSTTGFVKVLTAPGRDKILGVTIVGNHASDWIAEFVLAMRHGIGLRKLLSTTHIYPTMTEANKYAAGVWQRQHTPKHWLWLAGRYLQWRREG